MVYAYWMLKNSPLLQIWEKLENPLFQENLFGKKSVSQVLSTITRNSTIKRYTITRGDCTIQKGMATIRGIKKLKL